jgi:hypothetical protein
MRKLSSGGLNDGGDGLVGSITTGNFMIDE